jgi:hypothetical protein
MKCAKKDCEGTIIGLPVSLMFICYKCDSKYKEAFPCGTCGRLHWRDGSLVYNKNGDEVSLVNGKIVLKS